MVRILSFKSKECEGLIEEQLKEIEKLEKALYECKKRENDLEKIVEECCYDDVFEFVKNQVSKKLSKLDASEKLKYLGEVVMELHKALNFVTSVIGEIRTLNNERFISMEAYVRLIHGFAIPNSVFSLHIYEIDGNKWYFISKQGITEYIKRKYLEKILTILYVFFGEQRGEMYFYFPKASWEILNNFFRTLESKGKLRFEYYRYNSINPPNKLPPDYTIVAKCSLREEYSIEEFRNMIRDYFKPLNIHTF
ncbi:MAG: hypothetical protein QW197_02400 [Candidatus Aenigmatarchaeota archaeon]